MNNDTNNDTNNGKTKKVSSMITPISQKILLVEDEPHLAFTLKLNLDAEGFDVVHSNNGKLALEVFKQKGPFGIVLLDGMLPDLDGFDVAKFIRAKSPNTAIIMLTARASESDRLTGFQAGVDDYIAKPFHLAELVARIRRASERAKLFDQSSLNQDEIIYFEDIELDLSSLVLRREGQISHVTKLEADLICEFFRNKDKVLTREHLLQNVWGVSSQAETRTVDNFVMRIRKLLDDESKSDSMLESVRGKGYRLNSSR